MNAVSNKQESAVKYTANAGQDCDNKMRKPYKINVF